MAAILEEWFDGTLAAWTVSGADIATADNDEKLRLNASGEYAYRDITTPATGRLIVESDLYYNASGTEGYFEVIDSTGGPNVLASVRFTGGNVYVGTDVDSEVSHAFAAAEYRQVILAFDQDAATVRFYLSGADYQGRNGTWDFIAELDYSGNPIDRVSFRTTTTGTVYADMVKVYVPGRFIMGDSISDGKSLWSEQPNFASGPMGGRLDVNEDEHNAPCYQLGLLTGERVAGRGFGAATSTQILNGVGTGAGLQGLFLDQYGQQIAFYIGHNDLYASSSSATLKANILSIFNTLIAGGLAPDDITFCKIAPSDLFEGTPAGDENRRIGYNAWLTDFCAQNGCRLAFTSEHLNDNSKTTAYKRLDPTYDVGDGTHLAVAGTQVLAREMFRAKVPGGVLRRAGGGLAPASYLTDSPAIAKLPGAAYAVRATLATPARTTTYQVTTTAGAVAPGLAYAVATPTAVQAALAYAVRSQGQVAKGLAYALPGGGPSTVTMQRSCGYVLRLSPLNTYYVAATGSNGNDGSEGSPWATLQYAETQVAGGDEVIVEDGNYDCSGGVFSAPNVNVPSGAYSAGNHTVRPTWFHARNALGAVLDRGTGQGGAIGSTHDYTLVEDFEVIGAGPKGVSYFGGSYHWLRGNYIHGMRGSAGDNCEAVRIEDCDGPVIVENNLLADVDNPQSTSNAAGVKVYTCPPNVTSHPTDANIIIRFNEITTCCSGVKEKEGARGLYILGNVIHDLIGPGVAFAMNCQDWSSPPNGPAGGAADGVLAAWNIVYECGVFMRSDDTSGGVRFKNIVVRNNTVHLESGYTEFFQLEYYDPGELEIYDNIFYAPGAASPYADFRSTGEDCDTWLGYMDRNLWSDESGTVVRDGQYGGSDTQYSTWASWNAATGFEADSIIGDPLFQNSAARNYTLQSGSPAIGAGRFGGDLGALPFTGTPPTTTIQNGATYAVVTTATSLTPGAAYAVRTTPGATAKAMAYEVAPAPGRIPRSLAYAVRAVAPGTALGTRYGVRTTTAPTAMALAYEIDATAAVGLSRTLGYRVTTVPALALGLTYLIGYPERAAYRAVVVAPEPHAVSIPPETHTVEVIE